jgi:hypothetical protein
MVCVVADFMININTFTIIDLILMEKEMGAN